MKGPLSGLPGKINRNDRRLLRNSAKASSLTLSGRLEIPFIAPLTSPSACPTRPFNRATCAEDKKNRIRSNESSRDGIVIWQNATHALQKELVNSYDQFAIYLDKCSSPFAMSS